MRNKLITDFIISSNDLIIDAMKAIEKNGKHTCFIVDQKGQLKASLSDGDIRRGLMTGAIDLQSIALTIGNKNPVSLQVGQFGATNLSHASKLVIPLIDERGRLLDILPEQGTLAIGNKIISNNSKPFFIAEIGNNHNGSVAFGKELIDLAIESGADAVKFQFRYLDELYSNSGNSNDVGVEYTKTLLSEVNLPPEDMSTLINYAKNKGILVGCTPFDLRSLADMTSFGVDFIKIASADMTNPVLLKAAAKFYVPMIISTGMSSLQEIEKASKLMKSSMCPFALLHCNSTYPTPYKDVGLNFMPTLEKYSGSGVYGYSGHERGSEVPISAVALGARIIEKHFTSDTSMRGNDHKVSLLPDEFLHMVKAANNVFSSMGSFHRTLSQGEMINRENLAKSIVAKRDIKLGEVAKLDDFDFKSPGQGIQPDRLEELLGRILIKDIKKGEMVFLSHFNSVANVSISSEFTRPAGIPVRFHDVEKMNKGVNFEFVEFHLTNQDLELDLDNFKIPQSIKTIAVHAPELFNGDSLLDLAHEDNKIRERSINDMHRVASIASKLGAKIKQDQVPIIMNVGGQTTKDFLSEEKRQDMYDRVGDCMNKISIKSVDLIVQTMPPYPWHFGGQSYHNLFVNPEETLEFCKKWNYGICFDLSHSAMAAAWMERDVIEWIEMLGPWIRHLHLSDSKGVDGEGLQIGDGELDFQKISKALNDHALNISFIPEIWQGHIDGGLPSFKALEYLFASGLR